MLRIELKVDSFVPICLLSIHVLRSTKEYLCTHVDKILSVNGTAVFLDDRYLKLKSHLIVFVGHRSK